MKAIGVKIRVVTSATFDVGLFGLRKKKKKQKHEQKWRVGSFSASKSR